MKCVKVSAPAKVLLFGEHAVVYGSACVAAALNDLRLRVSIVRLCCDSASLSSTSSPDPVVHEAGSASDQPAAIEIVFHDFISKASGASLQRSFPLRELQAIMKSFPEDAQYLPRPSDQLLAQIDDTFLSKEASEDAKALRPALFLCAAMLRKTSICSENQANVGFKIQVSATENFPIGAGLGSSAAFSVALTGALAQLQDETAKASAPDVSSKDLELVNAYAFAAEVILHGAPSGVDNTVATFGGTLVFKKLPEPSFQRIECDLNQFRFLLVNTRVPRSTKEQVANVRALFDADRESIEKLFQEIDGIGTTFIDLGKQQNALSEAHFARQIVRNHEILNALGVGHPKIEQVASICARYGATTKLTGAGGGGCTLSLLPQSIDDTALSHLVVELEENGFQCFVSAVGGAGFAVE